MPTLPSSRGSNGNTPPRRVSWRWIGGKLTPAILADEHHQARGCPCGPSARRAEPVYPSPTIRCTRCAPDAPRGCSSMSTIEVDAPKTNDQRFLSSATMVVLTDAKPHLVRLDPAAPWEPSAPTRHPLTLRDLVRLVDLAAGAGVDELRATDTQPEALEVLVAALAEFGLLSDSPRPSVGSTALEERTEAHAPASPTDGHLPSPGELLQLRRPIPLRPIATGFEFVDHDGVRSRRSTATRSGSSPTTPRTRSSTSNPSWRSSPRPTSSPRACCRSSL